MSDWFIYAVITLILWGFWGFLPAIATRYIDSKSTLVYAVAGTMSVALLAFAFLGFKPQVHPVGMAVAFLTGVCETTGILLYFYAVTKGKVSLVVTTTGLYPIVTVLLALGLLHEHLTLRQGLGVFLPFWRSFLLTFKRKER